MHLLLSATHYLASALSSHLIYLNHISEMAEEMGISMERFDVVRRAMALAAHCNDNTPALSGE